MDVFERSFVAGMINASKLIKFVIEKMIVTTNQTNSDAVSIVKRVAKEDFL